jgi:hypothetical protein
VIAAVPNDANADLHCDLTETAGLLFRRFLLPCSDVHTLNRRERLSNLPRSFPLPASIENDPCYDRRHDDEGEVHALTERHAGTPRDHWSHATILR